MTTRPQTIPHYDDLPLSRFGGRHAWDVPACREIGSLGFIDDAVRMAALQSIRSGAVISLNAPLDVIDPPFFGREELGHSINVKREGLVLDDKIDALYPQVSSQWDALNHIGAAPGVFFGDTDLDAQLSGRTNGIDVWARTGIAGRGVLVDMEPIMREKRSDYSPGEAHTMGVNDVQEALQRQGVTLRFGDIVVLHTGFLRWYRDLDANARRDMSEAGSEVTAAGLEHTEDVARFLWDTGVAAIAADSLGVEAWPPIRTPEHQPFGFLHSALIGHLGMAIGELWELDALLTHCQTSSRWDFFLAAAPLNLRGGVGSPANALAIV